MGNVYAACTDFSSCLGNIGTSGLYIKFANGLFGQIITGFLPAILGIAGFLTVIIVVISGIQFITSSGNPEAAAAARGRLTFALVGFALIILAFAITKIIDRLFLNSGVV